MKLTDVTCVVSGGAAGLGAATAAAFLEAGARVAVVDIAAELSWQTPHSNSLMHARVDVTDEHAVKSAIADIAARFGGIHVCVNCAGVIGGAPVLGENGVFPAELFRRVVDINLTGTFLVLCRAAERMAMNAPDPVTQERGVIINTASIRAFDGGAGGAAYAASKGAIVSMTLALARDLAPHGIRVNTIAPGIMDTPMFSGLPAQATSSHIAKLQFPNRLGEPSEFASLACHLVENAYLNGETIRLDGALRV